MPTALGLRGQKGGAVAVALTVEAGEPRILASTFLKTHAAGDRLSFEPYAVAFELGAGDEARAAVAEGRARQDRLATEALKQVVDGKAAIAALLVNRAGWITDLLEYSLGWADHVPVAEALAVREALRAAFRDTGAPFVELDEKSLPALAAETLDLSPQDIDAQLKALGAVAGRPWRKEQKLACLAAWIAAADAN